MRQGCQGACAAPCAVALLLAHVQRHGAQDGFTGSCNVQCLNGYGRVLNPHMDDDDLMGQITAAAMLC